MEEINGKSILVRVSEGSSYRESNVFCFFVLFCFVLSCFFFFHLCCLLSLKLNTLKSALMNLCCVFLN